MIFEEYLRSLPDDKRLNLLKYFGRFGEPNAVLQEVAGIQPCVQNKKMDVRINHKYVFWHINKAFLVRPMTYLIPMNAIRYCYLYYGAPGGIGLIGTNGAYKEFAAYGSDGILVFERLCSYIKGFDNVQPYGAQDKHAELKVGRTMA
jgi:hypothetical protein